MAQTHRKTVARRREKTTAIYKLRKRGLTNSPADPGQLDFQTSGTMRKYGSFAEATLPVAPGYRAGRVDLLGVHPALLP